MIYFSVFIFHIVVAEDYTMSSKPLQCHLLKPKTWFSVIFWSTFPYADGAKGLRWRRQRVTVPRTATGTHGTVPKGFGKRKEIWFLILPPQMGTSGFTSFVFYRTLLLQQMSTDNNICRQTLRTLHRLSVKWGFTLIIENNKIDFTQFDDNSIK